MKVVIVGGVIHFTKKDVTELLANATSYQEELRSRVEGAFFPEILFEIYLHLWGSAIHNFINRCFNINPNIRQ